MEADAATFTEAQTQPGIFPGILAIIAIALLAIAIYIPHTPKKLKNHQ